MSKEGFAILLRGLVTPREMIKSRSLVARLLGMTRAREANVILSPSGEGSAVRRRSLISTWTLGLSVILATFLSLLAHAQVTPEVHPESPDDLKEAAAKYERAGQHRLAAIAYEQLIKVDPTSRVLISRHLVKLYAKSGQPEKALELAQEVMRDMPDPEAYLASVYERLGDEAKAKEILEDAIADNDEPARVSRLELQLTALQDEKP